MAAYFVIDLTVQDAQKLEQLSTTCWISSASTAVTMT